jgi:SSS family solute:Na+ symporter
MVSTDTTYLHSWGSILAQDVILPIYNRPMGLKAQMTLLRFCIAFIAVFAWFFSFYFSQSDYILQFFALTGTIYLGGAGACMLGGLYWKKGTTAGAYTAMSLGLFFAALGFLLNQKWADWIYPYLRETVPTQLESFRTALVALGEMLPIANWEASPEAFADKFPITSAEMYFMGMLSAALGYIIVSLITCRKDYNLDKLLHRGKYSDSESLPPDPWNLRTLWNKLIGITPEYTKGDRIIAWALFWYSVVYQFVVIFIAVIVWNIFSPWQDKWWDVYFYVVTLLVPGIIGVISTVWFMIGGTIDIRRLFIDLEKRVDNPLDNGQVINGETAAEAAPADKQ